ncbi:MAG: hypothetical protein Q9187_002121 [Circinaria calcarea]
MTDPKVNSTPDWQRRGPADSSATTESEKTTDGNLRPLASRAALLDQATKFLQDDEIREATAERKTSFLESKGLTKEEIQDLLKVPKIDSTSSTQNSSTPPVNQEDSTPLQTSTSSVVPPMSTSATSSQSRDVPPIITYPEFLLHSQKPPPLITAQRLLTALYVASGAATAIYGTSQYLVSPMIESLTSARHSLFETASSNLENLNRQLAGVVSSVPPIPTSAESKLVSAEDDEMSSVTSDPAELFHRDTGTQTSLPPSPAASSQDVTLMSAPITAISTQSQQLQTMHSQFSNILSTDSPLEEADRLVENEINELRRYLHALSRGGLYGHSGSKAGEKDDEVARVKAEIRGIKGVLLSAKTFPAGGVKSRVGA